MYVSLLFWLALAPPGYVIVRLLYKEDLDCGLFGTLGLSYLAVFGLLSPISIACYVLGLPVFVLSAACILAIVAAPIIISRRGWWREVGKLILTGLTLEFLVVAIDMAMGARAGAHLSGDAYAHLARIRFILNHGMSNLDPYVTAECFYPTYHTNLLHAMLAACSQLTRLDPISVWFASLVWVKLVIASGVYYLAWTVFGRRWPAWIAAMFLIGERGLSPLMIYPNQLSPTWLFPFAVAFAVQACRGTCTWRTGLKLGVASLVLGQIHGLYALFAAIALLPTLLVAAALRLRSGWRRAVWPAVCLPAVMIGLAFPAISRSMSPSFQAGLRADAAAEQHAADNGASPKKNLKKHKAYTYSDDGSMVVKQGWGWADCRIKAEGRKWIQYHRHALIVAGLCIALIGRRRWYAVPLAGVVATIVVVLYWAPICTFLVAQFRQPWILVRMAALLKVLVYAIGLPAIVYCLEQRLRVRWWMKSIVNIAIVLVVSTQYCRQKKPFTWKTHYDKATASADVRFRGPLSMLRLHDFLEQNLPAGETVLTDANYGMVLASIYDCRLVVAARASDGVPDRRQRLRDLKTLLHNATPWPQRSALLQKYEIKYFVPTTRDSTWAQQHMRQVRSLKGTLNLYRLETGGNKEPAPGKALKRLRGKR